MLQIISGRFFVNEECHQTPRKAILYSNLAWVNPIETSVAVLEPVDHFSSVIGYVLSFVIKIEKEFDGPKAGELISTGEDEVARQFQLLAMFGFRAYFAPDRDRVLKHCRARAVSSNEAYIPSRFVTRIFDSELRCSMAEVQYFVRLVDKVMHLQRKRYEALFDVLEAFQGGLEAINDSLDLAYSMMVYCLESLSQKFDEYEPTWDDYDQVTRGKLDAILQSAPGDVGAGIRATLVAASHSKLSARFRNFVKSHVTDDFFLAQEQGREWPIRQSQLDRALRHAYEFRSGYVHRLQSIRQQLHNPTLASGELFEWDGEPYMTMRGLVNLTLHVLGNFIERSERHEREHFNWRKALPGTLTLQMAPQYWLHVHEGVAELPAERRTVFVRSRFEGLLQHLVSLSLSPDGLLVDMTALMQIYDKLLPQSRKSERIAMLATYALYNSLLGPSAIADWRNLVEVCSKALDKRSIEEMAVEVILHHALKSESYELSLRAYDDFNSHRYAATTTKLPALVEIKIVCALANMSKDQGLLLDQERLLTIAAGEAVGMESLQSEIVNARKSHLAIDVANILRLPWKRAEEAENENGEGTTSDSAEQGSTRIEQEG